MPLTRPIPPEAYAVLEILRRDVPRPTTLPVMRETSLRWDNGCCAMGLAPNAIELCPIGRNGFGYPFGEVTSMQVMCFAMFFDEQTDAQATVDAIWPTGDE